MKEKIKKKLMMYGLIGVAAFIPIFIVLYLFNSAVSIFNFTKGDVGWASSIKSTSEERLIQAIENDELTEEHFNNMYFTEDDFLAMLKAVEEVKNSKALRDRTNEIKYQYYQETWKKLPIYVSDGFNSEGEEVGHYEYYWDWVKTTPEESVVYSAIEQEDEDAIAGLHWQPIYALCAMATIDDNNNWVTESTRHMEYDDRGFPLGLTGDDKSNIVVRERLDLGKVYGAINLFNTTFVYNYDASGDATSKQVTVINKNKVPAGIDWSTLIESTVNYMGTQKNAWTYTEAGTKSYKWGTLDPINGGESFEKISYYVETGDTEGHDDNNRAIEGEEDFWNFQPPEDDRWDGYSRWIKKIPKTTICSACNGYSSWDYYFDDNTVETDKFHYKYSEPCYKTANETSWSDNKQVKKLVKSEDVMKFYNSCLLIAGNFEWEWFLQILEQLPDTEEMVEHYREMYDEFIELVGEDYKYNNGKFASSTRDIDGHTAETLRAPDEITITDKCLNYLDEWVEPPFEGQNVIFGNDMGQVDFSGKYRTPTYGDYADDEQVNRTLLAPDPVTKEQLVTLITTYTNFQKDGSVFSDAYCSAEDYADAILKIQDNYGVSGLGLLAIACNESGWGTSDICKKKRNFVGWQAYDSNPYASATTIEGEWADAFYDCFEKIAKNYITGKYAQDTYWKMRHNEIDGKPTHQYCTDSQWPMVNAKIRRQFEVFLELGVVDAGEYMNPLGGSGYSISSRYGNRVNDGKDDFHNGIDLAAPAGTVIYSVRGGTVHSVGYYSDAGYMVVIDHGEWLETGKHTYTRYMHMLDYPSVKIGESVDKGTPLGYVGSTGHSSGNHLHFEIDIGSPYSSHSVNPLDYIVL